MRIILAIEGARRNKQDIINLRLKSDVKSIESFIFLRTIQELGRKIEFA
jgi:hypothetical protein